MTAAPAPGIRIAQGDITLESTDAIVNAANESLLGGGGVDGAIHRAAGPRLLEACRLIGGCPTGEARITPGFELAAGYVIHTVGPVWRGGNQGESTLLSACYRACLALAEEHALRSVAFPAISTGVYGYPLAAATRVAIDAVTEHRASSIRDVVFVCFDLPTVEAYRNLLD